MFGKKQRNISFLKDYVEYLEKNCSDNGRYLFRGQLGKDKLLPRLFRSKTKIQPKTPEIEKTMFDDFKRRGEIIS